MHKLIFILFFFVQYVTSQEATGTIFHKGNPISNVNIQVKNSSIRTQSDENGKFTIKVKKGDVLILSHVAMQTKRFRIKNSKPIELDLVSKINKLEEIKIAGSKNEIHEPKSFESAFGVLNTRGAGYAVRSFSAKDILYSTVDLPVALVGRVPNYKLTSSGVILRGTGFQTAYAIWDIDGIIFEGLPPFVNPEYVESIHIITNPTGLVQYGKRGRGGVIVVNTIKYRSSTKNKKTYRKLNDLQQQDIELPYNEKELSKIVKKIESDLDSLRLLAFVYESKGNTKLALQFNRFLLSKDRDNIQSYRDVAESLIQINQNNKAWTIYKKFLERKGDSIDKESFDLIFNDMERLYHSYNLKNSIRNGFESKIKSTKNYKNETRVVFEWTVPNETLSIEIVNPERKSINFQLGNSLKKNPSIEDIFIDETIKGNWFINLSISEEEKDLDGYLKVTIYKHWISPNKAISESKIFLLSGLTKSTYKLLDLKI